MFAEVRTVTIDRVLACDTTVLDFGELAVGETEKRTLRIRNLGATPAILEYDGLSATSAGTARSRRT